MKISRRENRLKLLKLSRLEVKNIFLLKRQEVLGLSSLLNFFIGGFHNFIGEKNFLLAFHPTYWRKSNFIGELEIPVVFFQFKLVTCVMFSSSSILGFLQSTFSSPPA